MAKDNKKLSGGKTLKNVGKLNQHNPTIKEVDLINHPSYYGGESNPYEAIKIIEAYNFGFRLGNAVKYILRAGKKEEESPLKDLKKARWYLNREIEKIEHKELGEEIIKATKKRNGRK